MTKKIVLCIIIGGAIGRLVFPAAYLHTLEQLLTAFLACLLFIVGIDIGRNKNVWLDVKKLGLKILLVPLATIVGTFAGVLLGLLFLPYTVKELLAVGAGFGWYSLSGVMIASMYSVELGAVACLANVFRELLAMLSIPLLVKYTNSLTAIAPGGATTMDCTLPLIRKLTDARTAIIAFVNGFILSLLVPIILPLILSL